MANPNIVDVTTILGNTTTVSATTSFQTLVNNKASSGKIMKVNTLLATNANGGNAVTVTVVLYPQDDLGGASQTIAHTISVPEDSTLIVIDKNTSFYLLEDRTLAANAGASGVVFTTSFDEIS